MLTFKKAILLRGALCCLMLLRTGFANGAPQVYIDDVAPLYYRVNGIPQGLLYDMMTEMGRRAQYGGQIVPLPLKRLHHLLSTDNDAIGTMWRTAESEDRHRWLCKLYDTSFFLVAARDSHADISSLEAARHLRIGVILGSPAETVAHSSGLQNIQSATNAESNLRKLALGRIDAWIATSLVLKATQQKLGEAAGTLRTGKELGRIGLYLVSAPGAAPQLTAKWQSACASMQKDGSAAAIIKHHGAAASDAGGKSQ
ncbi:substrate-binding periplasmic protein [Duganella callida]|uniref:Transporter substrate-binding domain-containing protein n=1 Tax=Duganella callida TaxID=2561932 RepID=A0A4Y9T1C2_9BURK|nr:transporter substrate-binding domain-containing protein [Duganella callida]TFW31373.1 transporter substrate-binding domain-containing protein [Duganella callida]